MLAIKKLSHQDKDSWLKLWQEYLLLYKVTPTIDNTEALWWRLHDDCTPIYGAAGFLDNKAVGLIHYVLHPTSWSLKQSCEIEDLYVSESARNQGVAHGMLRWVIEQAQSNDWRMVHWMTNAQNTEARRVYDKVAAPTGQIRYRIDIAD